MQTRTEKATGNELPALTPLRGVAALWVVLYHYTFQRLPSLNSEAYTHLVQKGYLAVDMFFLLSGFVLTHVYHDAFNVRDRRNYWKFISARIARLYPLHLFVLLIFVATALASRLTEYASAGMLEPVAHRRPAVAHRACRQPAHAAGLARW
jgi:peptidoglycan/LPS O-acetylase OafA/YrhL